MSSSIQEHHQKSPSVLAAERLFSHLPLRVEASLIIAEVFTPTLLSYQQRINANTEQVEFAKEMIRACDALNPYISFETANPLRIKQAANLLKVKKDRISQLEQEQVELMSIIRQIADRLKQAYPNGVNDKPSEDYLFTSIQVGLVYKILHLEDSP